MVALDNKNLKPKWQRHNVDGLTVLPCNSQHTMQTQLDENDDEVEDEDNDDEDDDEDKVG